MNPEKTERTEHAGMKEILFLNPEHASDAEVATYNVREAARAIVTDQDGKIALLHVKNYNYHKLPGGGLEHGEDKLVALTRECQEEIGCDVDVAGEVGMVTEYRKFLTRKQISYCYRARVKGEKGAPAFTESELSGGFEIVWVPYDEALRLVENGMTTATNIEGKEYIAPRDLALLKAAKEML